MGKRLLIATNFSATSPASIAASHLGERGVVELQNERVEETLYSMSETVPQAAERRDGERYLTLFRVGTLLVGGERQLCLIKNISAGGMLIRAYSDMTPGTELSVELKQGQHIAGSVSWIEGHSAGIAFAARIDVVDLLSISAEDPRPRMPRVETRCMATVRIGAQAYGMIAVDISQGGMKVECERTLAIGSDVVITLPGLAPMSGVLRWGSSGCYGIGFNRLLALSEVVDWLKDQREGFAATATA